MNASSPSDARSGRSASGIALVTRSGAAVLDAWFPHPVLGDDPPAVDFLDALATDDDVRRVTRRYARRM